MVHERRVHWRDSEKIAGHRRPLYHPRRFPGLAGGRRQADRPGAGVRPRGRDVRTAASGAVALAWPKREMNNTDARLWHPWLRIHRVMRVMLHTRRHAEAWAVVRVEFKNALALRSEIQAAVVVHP